MELSNSKQEYLKTIYLLSNSGKKIRVTDIANRLKITKPSVNNALKELEKLNYVEYAAYKEIKLTKSGEIEAKKIIKKYDLLKLFLEEVLKIDEENASIEADNLKHAISKNTYEKLEEYVDEILNLKDIELCYNENNEKCKRCKKYNYKMKKLKEE